MTIAAFELGNLYEKGSSGITPDMRRSWFWYRKGSEVAEPNALARLAERDDAGAAAAADPATRNARWLASFRLYTAAAERARLEDWPDAAWRAWRYRRASLARLLAREGLTRELAANYEAMLAAHHDTDGRRPWARGSD